VRCLLCERRCLLVEGGRGWCRTRVNRDGILYTLAYWRVVRMRVPRWLVIRAKAPADDVEAEAAEI